MNKEIEGHFNSKFKSMFKKPTSASWLFFGTVVK